MFNEITKNAIEKAFEKPRPVNVNLVDAQQARRVLDRLVGYKISPLLWDKVRRGLSAGRVQTVALRLIVDREREIRAFIKQEYWTIDVNLTAKKPPVLDRAPHQDERRQRRRSANEATAEAIVAALDGANVHRQVGRHAREEAQSGASVHHLHLQQESSRKLRFSVKRTMMLAQRLYEGVELGKEGSVGLITYMRTDSTRVSDDALDEVRELDRRALRRGVSARQRPTSIKPRRTRRTRTKPFARPRSMRTPGDRREVSGRRRAEAVPADLDALCRFADDAGGVRSDHHRRRRQGQGRRDVYVPRHRQRARNSTASSKVYEEGKDQKDEDDEELKHKLPLVTEGEELQLQGHPARAAFHRAAAALQRSDAGEEAGSRMAWAGRPPTRRFFPPFRSAST